MNSKLIATLLALFFATVLMTGGSLSLAQSHQTTQSFAVSKYGTLLEIFDKNGKSRLGKLANDGFQVSYQSKGKTTSVSAVGAENVTGLLPGQIRTDGHSATVTVTTSDQALEITSYFTFDEKAQKLSIHRKLRNISGGPLTLNTMIGFVDPTLVAAENGAEVLSRLKARGLIWDCWPRECIEPPPPCTVDCIKLVALKQAQLITKINPETGKLDMIAVQWQDDVTNGTPAAVEATTGGFSVVMNMNPQHVPDKGIRRGIK